MRKKIKKLSTEKKKAWNAFSKYIRARDKKCITCGTTENLQAGHFIGGRHNSILFNEKNCHAQCYGCNVGKKGNMVFYYRFMESVYGQEIIDELIQKDRELAIYKITDYEDICNYFKDKLEELKVH